jgi:tetratricopeptide (TPR) repeat protein
MFQNFFRICLIVLISLSSSLCFADDTGDDNTDDSAIEQAAPAARAQPTAVAVKAAAAPAARRKITPDMYYYAGESYYNARIYSKAIKYYYAATQVDKNYLAAWKKLAFCYYKLNMHKYAYSVFQKVLKFDPEDKDAKDFMTFYANIMEKSKKQLEKREMIDPLWRSAALPGWGQFYNNQSLKGIFISGGFIVAAGLTAYSVTDEKLKYNKYLQTNENHEIAFKEAQSAWNTALIWTIVTAVIYAGGLVDAAMNYDCVESKFIEARLEGGNVMLCAAYRW